MNISILAAAWAFRGYENRVEGSGREIKGRRKRQYDLPSTNEMAVVMAGDGIATEPRGIVIQGRDPV